MIRTKREQHPRPDFMRDFLHDLNGEWEFAFDDGDEGLKGGWFLPEKHFENRIIVPFAYQTKRSGLGPTDEIHPVLWYRRNFMVPPEAEGKRILLCFGAVDYSCGVYVNGHMVGTHEGGYTPFRFDITPFLGEGENDLCLRVVDEPDPAQPRGKQYWERGVAGCWYTPVSGIWQSVYMETVGAIAVERIHITPDIDRSMFTADVLTDWTGDNTTNRNTSSLKDEIPVLLELEVSYEGEVCKRICVEIKGRQTRIPVDLSEKASLRELHLWGPGHPSLYDLKVTLRRGEAILDTVLTYFGMRKVECRDGKIYLNNEPLYQRLILDQGYWEDTLLTPPSRDALSEDVKMTLALGYNGARKHQKIEDPGYYYQADCQGLLVWGELPSSYTFNHRMIRGAVTTMTEFIERDYNHPCIIVWVTLNESWGVKQIWNDARQQSFSRMLYQMTKAMDGTRLCSGNDGWEQTQTDICALHDYADSGRAMAAHFESREHVEKYGCDVHPCYVKDHMPRGDEAFMITEYGGIAFSSQGRQGTVGGMETWGYHDKVKDEESFFARFESVTEAIRRIPYCQGYCYTQLTDVMQEVNGLLTETRKPKIDVKRYAYLNNPVGQGDVHPVPGCRRQRGKLTGHIVTEVPS